jgi:preprotein translocase subunit YajC
MIHMVAPVRGAALLALQAPGPEQAPNAFFTFLMPMGLILIIFYFLLIRPANKKQKAVQQMIDDLKNGDKVITTGGIHGVVAGITDEIIQLRVAPNIKIEISRNAVAALQKEQGGE